MNDNISKLPKRPAFKPNPNAARELLAGVADAINSDVPLPEAPEPERYIKLPLHMIQIYEHNPRHARNAQYDEIKESLRIEGLGTVLLHVTKRPGESIYTLSYGGGTRLRAIKELHSETGEDRFSTVRCLIQPFKSEVTLRASHIKENIQRAEMSFWDTANAFVELRRHLGSESGLELSRKDFVERCKSLGITSINLTGLNYYEFATYEFTSFRFAKHLSRTAIERIQPQFAAYERLGALKGGLEAIAEVQPVMERLDSVWDGTFDVNTLLKGTDIAIATALGLSMAEMPKAIEISKEKQTTWDKLMSRLRPATAQAPAPVTAKPSASTPLPLPLPTPSAQEVQDRLAGRTPFPTFTTAQLRAVVTPTPAPVSGSPLQRIVSLAKAACFKREIDKQFRTYDQGFGWFMEPITTEHVMREKLDDYTRSRLDLWSVMSQLSGQWHEDVYLTLPESSLWRRAMSKQPGVTSEERQAIAAVPNAQIAFANFMIGLAPWGSRTHFFGVLNNVESDDPHDDIVELIQAQFALMRAEPERFKHVRQNAKGEPRDVRNGDWE